MTPGDRWDRLLRRLRLSQLIVIAFGTLILVSVLASTAAGGRWHARERELAAQHFLELKAEQFAESLGDAIEQRQRLLDLLSDRRSARDAAGHPAAARTLLDSVQSNWPEFVWLAVTDAGGRVIASSAGLLGGADVSASDWFVHGRAGAYVGGVRQALLLHARTRADGAPARLIDLAVPLQRDDGGFAGVLVAQLDEVWLDQLLQQAALTTPDRPPFRLLLEDREGRPIAPVGAARIGPDEFGTAAVPMPRGGPAQLGWQVRAAMSSEVIGREVRHFQQKLAGVALGGAFVCLPLLLLLAHLLARPLAALGASVQAVRAGGEGDALGIPPGATRETAMLGMHLRGMLDEVSRQRRELQAGAEQMHSLLQAAPDAILSVGPDRRIVLANRSAEAIFGDPPQALTGRALEDLLALGERHALHLRNLAAGVPGEAVVERGIELVGRRADGSEFPMEASIFTTAAGGEPRMTAILRDITERRRTEAALHSSSQRYRDLFFDHPLPMWVYDQQTLRFLEVNEVAIAHYGWTRAEFLQMELLDIWPIDDGEAVKRAARRVRALPFSTTGPWTHRKRSGEALQVMVHGHALTWQGRAARLAVAQDITDLMRAQRAMQQQRRELAALSQQLMTKEMSERAALAQVLHDRFAQNLVAARLTVEMVAHHLEGVPAAAALSSVLDLLGEAIDEVRGLLGDLRPPLLDDLGLRAALQFEIDRRRPSSGAEIVFAEPSDAGRATEGEPRLKRGIEYALFMILREALHNAVMHARAARIEVSLTLRDRRATASVEDDGVGFDVAGGSDRVGHLGLIGMQERARSIGALLDIESRPGHGTCVRVVCKQTAALGDTPVD